MTKIFQKITSCQFQISVSVSISVPVSNILEAGNTNISCDF